MLSPQLLLVLAYLLMEHFSVVLGLQRLAAWTLALLVVLLLMAPLRERRPWAWTLLLAACVALALPGARHWAPLALMLPPTVINGVLAAMFGHTLAGGRMPLVERMVRLLHAPEPMEDAEVLAYARRVTWAWTLLLAGNATTSLLLALLAVPNGLLAAAGIASPLPVPMQWWSWFANLGCYGLVLLLFVVEYTVRSRRFPWQPYRNLFDFLRRAAAIGPQLAAGLAAERVARAARIRGTPPEAMP
jgi:uncharacterized membrane protein